MRRFISVFARPEQPLALFLDDLQWLDAATLDLIEDVLTQADVRDLLLIGANRDNEVDAAHPLARKLAAIHASGAKVSEIKLAPLQLEHVRQLIADAVHCDPVSAQPLAQLVYARTGGNPFFAIQFLHAFADEELLAFDPEAQRWNWDLQRIHAKGYADNVVDLMVGRLARAPPATRRALQGLACLGNVVDNTSLAIALGASEGAIHAALWEAVRQELVERLPNSYRFAHDRVQEAAYALIPEDERAAAHLRIGRRLVADTPTEKREERVFEIVGQLNRGSALILVQDEREDLAELNLIAGKRAKVAAAYNAALMYFTAGRALLEETGWKRCYRLTFDLELNSAECEYLLGDLASAEKRLAILSTLTCGTADFAAITCLRINLYTTLDQSDRAVAVGLEYLRRIDGQWSLSATAEDVRQEYDRLCQRLRSTPIDGLLDMPPMRDPDRCATMDVLTVLTSPALFTDLNLFRLVVSRMASLSLAHGNNDGSCLAYTWLGGVLGTYLGEYQAGFSFGRLGLDLVEKHGLDRFRARVYLVFAVHVAQWTQPLQMSRAFLRRAFEVAKESGDLSYAAYSCIDLVTNRIATSDLLSDVEQEADRGLEFARRVRFGLASDCIAGQLQLIRMLRGRTANFTSFNDAGFDEGRFEERLENNPQLAIGACWYWIRKLQASVYANDDASAIGAMSKLAPLMWTAPTQFELAEYHFFGALARAAHCDLASAEERSKYLEALADHCEQLGVWAKNCPATFANRAALVAAEIARLEGCELDALRLYEEAIRLARNEGFIQNEGLAHERAAWFCGARHFQTSADAHLKNARRCFVSWGADGKVRQLDQLYPRLRQDERTPSPTGTIEAPVERLDLFTVIKVSQAVSGEIVFEKLLESLMRTAIEHAGAERGLLIAPRSDELQIEAEATTSGEDVTVHLPDGVHTAAALPESLVQYVMRTQETVILDDARSQNPFSSDPYIVQRRARSIICLPLINHAKLVGILYLENNLAPQVYTPDRVTVLKVLASQAAMSLENSRLYRDLEDREAKIRQIIETVPGLLWSAGPDGEPTQLNQRLLDYSGMRFEDFLRLGWYKFLHPDDLSETANAFSHAMQTGTSYQAVNRLRRADGDYRWHHTRGEPLRNGQGRIIQWYGLSVDIDQGKQAEDRLRRSEAYLAEAQRLSQTGSFGWTPSTGELHWSDETFRILEYDRSIKPTIERVLQRIHPGDCAMMRQLFDETSRGEKDFDVTHRLLMADGSVKFVHVLSHPLKDAAGNLEIFGALMDVSENTCLYRDLAKREAKIRRLVEANIIGVFIGDFDGRILEANDAFLRIVGYDREDLAAGRINWKDLTPRDWRERDARWIEEHKRTGVRLPIEKEYFRKDGSRVPILLGSATVEEGGNQTVTFVLDLSERKQAEAEARESERRYRETQTQLAHANRVATLGQLTASIAHEVNQPIAAALTNAQAALRWLGAEPPNMDEVRQALGRIVRDSDRGGAVVQRIRALIKGTRPREERVEINAAIRDVIEITHGEAMKNGVSVRTELVEGLPLVPGDRIELQQVILNLVLNAIEAMSETSEGPRELLITTGKTELGEVLVAVRDSGPGLAPAALEHLFRAFHTTKPNGLGLGLSICRSIVEAHGGRLWASANAPRGAILQFTLPTETAAPKPEENQALPTPRQ